MTARVAPPGVPRRCKWCPKPERMQRERNGRLHRCNGECAACGRRAVRNGRCNPPECMWPVRCDIACPGCSREWPDSRSGSHRRLSDAVRLTQILSWIAGETDRAPRFFYKAKEGDWPCICDEVGEEQDHEDECPLRRRITRERVAAWLSENGYAEGVRAAMEKAEKAAAAARVALVAPGALGALGVEVPAA